ncbi:MAG: methyltransferase domain-containing protein [Pseudomonadota bacterium]|nr:methyltransferase domain-containing protein [Pseudomonadota bacterium]
MASASPALHVYDRDIQTGERTSLSMLAARIAAGARVLDLGCGSGAIGRHLAARDGHGAGPIDGLTISADEASLAAPHYRRVEVADLDTCDLTTLFPAASYDVIVCADVLEHTRQPERVLHACRSLLAPGGQLLLSVPNAAYCGLVADLMQGEFRYRDEGLLDRTHLRFFTRQSLLRFMADAHWAIETLEPLERQLPDSEFATRFDELPPAVARYLLSGPDALTYQFIGVARPSAPDAPLPLPPEPSHGPAAQAHFTTELYLKVRGEWSERHKLTTRGVLGELRQTLRFALPASTADAPITQLRLDPADRPGFLHLYRIVLQDADGAEQWAWRPDDTEGDPLAGLTHHDMLWQEPRLGQPQIPRFLLGGREPWLHLPIDACVLAGTLRQPGAQLLVELGWPMSADYLALAAPLYHRLAAQEQLTEKALFDLDASQQRLAHTEHCLQVEQQARAHDVQALRLHTQHVENESAHHRRAQQAHIANLQNRLNAIENSLLWRAVRPLARAKRLLLRLTGLAAPSPAAPAPAAPAKEPQEPDAPPAPPPAAPGTPGNVTPDAAPSAPPSRAVDIIVPVYRGLADTRRCIDSVLASTCTTSWRLIIINDASPEPELTSYLRDIAPADTRIHLLENADNLGFVGTVNRGMALALESGHDVVLLNADTEVANDWLDRLRRTAYRDDRTATVTPFSNNATICSYPRFCQANPLPPGMDTATLDALCAQTHPGAALDVPTGVGFCMYIRHATLQAVGLFDTEHFGKGYGEENDFCQRAMAAGWRNLHALDTFVLHTGGVSFGDSKSPREQAALHTLRQLHPDYEAQVQAFVQADPARNARLLLDGARLARSHPRPLVLMVLHASGGGTLRHAHELAAHMAHRMTCLLLTPAKAQHVELTWLVEGETQSYTYRLPAQDLELTQALRALGVAHVHFHHFMDLPADLLQLPQRLEVSYDFTAHDYYTVCPQISLTTRDYRYCTEQGPAQCHACLAMRPAPTGESIEDWRVRHAHWLASARHLFTPSHDAAQRLARYVPGKPALVVPHTDLPAHTRLPTPRPRRLMPDAHLRVMVLGAVNQVKGSTTLEAAAMIAAAQSAPLQFYLLGYADRPQPQQPHNSLSIHGMYRDEDLPRLIERLQPDLLWFPAQWPETYSYTLSAALRSGLPIVAPDLGAFPERLAGRRWSWLRPWDTSPADWVAFFNLLRERHFMTGTEPSPAPALPVQAATWCYADDYLRGIPTA